ncbi:nuclear transport factor 2 family protein [Streptomyces sp. Act143]|uniref:nuclear transport factor 2 family protein n=1 Tax=Streptomyces sp. Act143 TaxID=2200760 RepID=UPI0015E8281E|nr:nuclear transport factor 2 family protein [Streptomyces sp. Act143]
MSDEREIQGVLARCVRATDQCDGKSRGALFADDAVVQSFSRTGPDSHAPVTPSLIGGAAVEYAVDHCMAPHSLGGWAGGSFGSQGAVRRIESGYYDTDLRRIDGSWKSVGHRILLDMPYVVPGV